MNHLQTRILLLCLLLVVPPQISAQTPTPTTPLLAFVESVKKSVDAPFLKKANFGVYIQNLSTGEVLFAQNEDKQLSPASNTKILSTASALYHLGPEYRFRTLLAIDAKSLSKGKVSGNLYLKGYGDPKLTTEDLWLFTDKLVRAGISEITGDLVIDDTFFDKQWSPPGFDDKPTVQATYRPLVSATSLNFNTVELVVTPAEKAGEKPLAVVDPESKYLTIDNKATTETKNTLSLACEEKKRRIACVLKGSIAQKSEPAVLRRRVLDPPMFVGLTLSAMLAERKIKLRGSVREGALPKKSETVYLHVSEGLGVLIRDINKLSNNFMAEMVLKTLGAEYKKGQGSTAAGVEAIGQYLETIGIAPGSYEVTNGSGLWGKTHISAKQMVQVLQAAAQDFRIAPDFIASMAIAGADGTIRSRMKDSKTRSFLRAKTGTLNGVICLSGYLQRGSGNLIGFALLMNDVNGAAAGVHDVQNSIGIALAEYLLAIQPTAGLLDKNFVPSSQSIEPNEPQELEGEN